MTRGMSVKYISLIVLSIICGLQSGALLAKQPMMLENFCPNFESLSDSLSKRQNPTINGPIIRINYTELPSTINQENWQVPFFIGFNGFYENTKQLEPFVKNTFKVIQSGVTPKLTYSCQVSRPHSYSCKYLLYQSPDHANQSAILILNATESYSAKLCAQ